MSAAVEAHDVFRIYPAAEGSAAALQGLTLDVTERELVVVFGPSGSGKSTLLRILAGLDSPSAGSVHVFGEDLRKLRGRSLAEYRARTLGYADQHYTRALAPELTARQLVGLRLGLLGVPSTERGRVADGLLERAGLLDRRDARPGELSGGQQQRVAICAALAHRPRLLIADEPTGELDSENAARTYALVRDLAREAGTTAVVVSHDPDTVAVADRVIQIRDGRVSGETVRGQTYAVVSNGWIRLPEELLRGLSLDRHATLELEARAVRVTPAGEPTAPAEPALSLVPEPATRTIAAEIRGLTKVHGSGARATEVFRGASFAFEAGGLSVVTGPSGSGKSTLLHLLAGLDLPTEGEVVVLGRSLATLDATARARLRRSQNALVAQGTDLIPFLSVQENVELALALRGVGQDAVTARAAAALGEVGLAALAAQRLSRLSMGERQRVAFARALGARPALLLADEPTARLDEANARAVGALLAELARSTGAAIVCATHDPVLIEHASLEVGL